MGNGVLAGRAPSFWRNMKFIQACDMCLFLSLQDIKRIYIRKGEEFFEIIALTIDNKEIILEGCIDEDCCIKHLKEMFGNDIYAWSEGDGDE